MEDPLDKAQRQADEALERTVRLRRMFLEQGVQRYVQEIADEHRRKEGRVSGRSPEGTVENEILDCESCGVELEVMSLNPPTVERAPEEQEDWGE